ncbi:MAG: Tex family protein [Rikenellaceae bacterium]
MLEKIISERVGVSVNSVKNTIKLLEEGATVPFISRYRKEATGSLDELQVEKIKLELEKLSELESRKNTILKSIEDQGKMTPDLKHQITTCYDSAQLEDIYLPYKPKRRTRATIARERGLEPLSKLIVEQRTSDIEAEAKRFISAEVPTLEDAIAGACDIIAESIAEDPKVRAYVRGNYARFGTLRSKVIKGKEDEGAKYSDYFDMQSSLKRMPAHRILAMLRGEEESILRLSVEVEAEQIIDHIARRKIKSTSPSRRYLLSSIEDSYKRLLRPSIERESIKVAKERADDEAIAIFADNLRQLLLSSPLGQKRVIAIDPGFRTGCKVVVLDANGSLIQNSTIYPHPPQNQIVEASKSINALVAKYNTEAIAIGDGTAGRETQFFLQSIGLPATVQLFMVNEDGASIYSASPVAREEFADYDVTVRGAVSIGRRLIDPLSELVKIEPKSIGVGQYQHSVDQAKLKDRLSTTVESCVNMVGVNINTASKHILTYISGLGSSLASNIVAYRAANGDFTTRRELLKVPRLGEKAFEQAAGFLRVVGGTNPLDNSAVHPESYSIVKQMATDAGESLANFITNKELRCGVEKSRYVSGNVGMPTINDILDALDKQGLDPREELTAFEFDPTVRSIDDLREGMTLPGIVTNITAFGAFVSVGIKQDGLVHISQLADRYVASPSDVVKLNDQVIVKVIEVDQKRGRISLTMRNV